MNIFEAISIRIPCTVCNEHYEIPLSDVLLSKRMLKERCPICQETECPPLFQTRLIGSEVLGDLVRAWKRLENNVCRNNGELVFRNAGSRVPRHAIASAIGADGRNVLRAGNTYRDRGSSWDPPKEAADPLKRARDYGLDETLKATFPCSDALSSVPDPA